MAKVAAKSDVPNQSEGFSLKKFFNETAAEMRKVSWSTKVELVRYTGVVGVAVAIVCVLIWICDTFFARLFHLILN